MNKIIFGFACASLLAFTSCADSFLKEEPKSESEGSTFFSSAKNAQAAVNNFYRAGGNGWYSGGVYDGTRHMYGGWRAGMFLNNEYGEMSHSLSKPLARMDVQPSAHDNWLANIYNDPYANVIQRSNAVIDLVPKMDNKATGITDAEKLLYVAEAKLFRGQNYMWLVRQFGAVPLVLKNQTATDVLEVPRAPKAQVWARVIQDLEEALPALPVKSQYDNNMRVTAPIASASLIDAYMSAAGILNQPTLYAKAAAEAKKFLPGGAYANIHALEAHDIDANFKNPTDTTVTNYEINGANINIFNPGEGSAYNKLRNVNAAGPVAKGYNKWAKEAPAGSAPKSSKEFIYAIEFFIGISNIGCNQHAWPTTVEGLGSAETKTTLLNNSYRPERRLLALYDSANDMRCWERQFYANFFIKKNLDPVNNPAANTPSPYFYYDFHALKETNSSGRHWAVYRLAEMYLFAAEAIAQAEGVTAQAIDALVAIKKRAYITKTEADIRASIPTDKQKFIEEVWRERYREFPVEYKAWWDILRTGKYPKTNEYSQYTPGDNPAIQRGDCIFVDASTVYNEIRGESGSKYQWSGKSMYLPFAESVMQKNPKLRENVD